MKKTIISLLLILVALTGKAQVNATTALEGSWTGKLNVGAMSLTIVFHLEQAKGFVKVTMDSPDQSVKGIPCTKDYLSDDSLAVKVDMIKAAFQARLRDGRLDGIFSQAGMSLPLTLERGEEKLLRPQTPIQPYPYLTEEVTFTNVTDGATLAGTLTYPVGYEKMKKRRVPVVLMISGSGQQDRDEQLFDHRPFLVIADYLARHGIASLRYDDRATGASTGGELKNATSEDFMRDASAGLDFLRSQKKFGRVGCLGHSEGGLIAFMLGAQRKTDFIVSLAGPCVKGDTLLALQSNRIMQLSGMPAIMTAAKVRQQQVLNPIPWMQWFVNYDPTENIRNTRCPVFALNGSNDCQVIAAQNLTAIQSLLPPSKNSLFKEYLSLNHLFQHSQTGLPTEYRAIEETISTEVLDDISQWINNYKSSNK